MAYMENKLGFSREQVRELILLHPTVLELTLTEFGKQVSSS
jgi:hypothetical protein